MEKMPKWADVVLIPLISLILAAFLSALVILAIGEDPLAAVKMMVTGALGSTYGWGYTLYYATNFLFTGLAVAVAFHARMFNIGGEGQAMLGGLGVALVCLYIPWPHWSLALIFASLGAALFGAAWAAIPAYLQAKRGSHIVITTIMFNFIAAAVLNYMLVNVLKPAGAMDPATARFAEAVHLPSLHELLAPFGIAFSKSAPANVSLLVAVAACVVVWLLIWRTRLGYEIRAYGHSDEDHHDLDADLGWACGHDGDQQRHGRGRAPGSELYRGRRFHRHRRGADGAQPSLWRFSGRDPLWLPLSGRRGTGALDLDPARIDRRHSGTGHPLYRRAGQYGADTA
jgi:ABC-type uncharacterized transport system permease subunit